MRNFATFVDVLERYHSRIRFHKKETGVIRELYQRNQGCNMPSARFPNRTGSAGNQRRAGGEAMDHELRTVEYSLWILALLLLIAGGCEDRRDASKREPTPEANPSKSASAEGTDDRYSTVVSEETIPAGAEATVRLEIAAGDGLKVNHEYPSWNFEVDEAKGLELEKKSFSREDFSLTDAGATAEATVRGETPGEATISGTANFSVCNDETCHILRDEDVRFRLRVDDSTGDSSK